MSNLTDLLPAGAGGKQVSFVASGTLSSGQTVALNSDGTVSVAAQSTITTSIGTPTEYDTSGDYQAQRSAYDPVNNKVVIFYTNLVIVGTVSGSSISFGTPVTVSGANAVTGSVAYDASTGNVFLMFKDSSNSSYPTGILGTISGTSISFGTRQVVKSGGATNYYAVCYDPNSEKLIGFYSNVAVLITTSGTTFTVGTETQYDPTQATSYTSAVYDTSTSRVVVCYYLSSLVKSAVGTVGASTVTFGTPVTADNISSGAVGNAVFDSYNNKVVITYQDNNTSGYGTGIVGTVSGTSISFGTPVIFKSANILYPSCAYDANARKVVVVFRITSPSDRGEAVILTVSGTSFTFTSSTVITTSRFQTPTTVYNSVNTKVVIASGLDLTNSEAWVFTTGYVNNASERFIGISDAAISDTASGSVTIKGGVAENSSLNVALETGTETNLTGKTQSPYPAITYDITNSKFVVFFQDGNNFNYGTAVVVTVSGTNITFGTPVVFNSGSTNYIDATYSESNGKHLVVYPDYGNSQQATAIVGTVSGTSISFGSEQVYDTGTTNTIISVAYNSNLDKYLAGSTPSSGTINVTVLTVSGTTVSAGTPVSLSGTKYKPNIASNESASDFVLTNNKNDNQSEAHLISVSGTVPTVETSTDLSAVVSTSYPNTGLAFLGDNKFVCVYNENNTNNTYTRTITVSGTSLSLGTASSAFTVDQDSAITINGVWPLFKATTTSAYLYYQDDTSNYLKYVPISISGTTATSGTEVTYTSEVSAYAGFLYSADAKQSLSFYQSADSGQQTAAIAQNASLTIGSDYYVQSDGSLSTTASSVLAGKALSSTSINLDYTT